MKTKLAEKWFYQHQERMDLAIKNKYSKNGLMNYQDITDDRYYENWNVIRKSDGKFMNILVMATERNGCIFIYELEQY